MTVFTACGGENPAPDSLLGTGWALQDYANPSHPSGLTTPLGSAVPTLEFGQGEGVHGFGGCNNFQGNYAVSGESLTLGPLAITSMYCGEGVMDQESAFLGLLQGVVEYRIEGEQLHLLNDAGQLVALFNAR